MKKSLEPCYYWLVAPGSRAVTPGTTVVVVVVVVVVVGSSSSSSSLLLLLLLVCWWVDWSLGWLVA